MLSTNSTQAHIIADWSWRVFIGHMIVCVFALLFMPILFFAHLRVAASILAFSAAFVQLDKLMNKLSNVAFILWSPCLLGNAVLRIVVLLQGNQKYHDNYLDVARCVDVALPWRKETEPVLEQICVQSRVQPQNPRILNMLFISACPIVGSAVFLAALIVYYCKHVRPSLNQVEDVTVKAHVVQRLRIQRNITKMFAYSSLSSFFLKAVPFSTSMLAAFNRAECNTECQIIPLVVTLLAAVDYLIEVYLFGSLQLIQKAWKALVHGKSLPMDINQWGI